MVLTDEEMAARVARKRELLKQQSRRSKAQATIFNGDYQAGKRSADKNAPTGIAGFVKGQTGFLLPDDVGGVNLASPFGSGEGAAPKE